MKTNHKQCNKLSCLFPNVNNKMKTEHRHMENPISFDTEIFVASDTSL